MNFITTFQNKKTSAWWFILFFLLICGFTHVYQMMQLRPQSVHMWAMCDRGSVARNYEQESMNFFKPRVHETKEGDGITGLEFPIMNYVAAIFYKIFGFSEFWYRFIMYLVYAAGIISSYLVSGFFLRNTVFRFLSVLLYTSTPILTYYAANFIPDTASFGFMMTAWYFFFSYLERPGKVKILMFFLCVTLATLIKLTSAIGAIIMLGMIIWSYIRRSNFAFSKENANRPLLILLCLATLGLTYYWYAYAKMLNDTYGLSVFLMKSMQPGSWQAVKDVATHVNEIWVQFYYFKPIYYLLLFSFIFSLIYFKKIDEKLKIVYVGYFFGVITFVYLMFIQFNSHDYYIITLLPLLFYLFISVFHIIEKLELDKKTVSILNLTFILITLFAINFNKKHQEFRMDEHCWLYDWSRYKDFQTVEPYVQSLGISKKDKAIAILDYSPNIALYFLNMKGWSVADVAEDEAISRAMVHRPEYLVIADSTQINRAIFKSNPPVKIGQYLSISFYRLKYE